MNRFKGDDMRFPKIALWMAVFVVAACASGSQKYADDYYDQGLVFYERMEYARSVDSFNKVLELEPNGKDAYKVYYNRGNAYLKSRQYDQAIYDFTKALELTPSSQKQMRYFILESRGVIEHGAAGLDLRFHFRQLMLHRLHRGNRLTAGLALANEFLGDIEYPVCCTERDGGNVEHRDEVRRSLRVDLPLLNHEGKVEA